MVRVTRRPMYGSAIRRDADSAGFGVGLGFMSSRIGVAGGIDLLRPCTVRTILVFVGPLNHRVVAQSHEAGYAATAGSARLRASLRAWSCSAGQSDRSRPMSMSSVTLALTKRSPSTRRYHRLPG